MGKPGRKRKARRGALKRAEAATDRQVRLWEGEHVENTRLVKSSFRWPTDCSAQSFDGIPSRTLGGRELAAKVTINTMLAADQDEIEPQVGQSAVSNFIRMEGQNQSDQAETAPPLQQFFTLSAGASDAEYRQWQREKDIIEAKKRDDNSPEDPA